MVKQVGVEGKGGTLGKGGKCFVNRVDGNICPLFFGRLRHVGKSAVAEKLQVCSVRLVNNQNLAPCMDNLCNLSDVRTDSVVVWRGKDDRRCIRILIQTAGDFFSRNLAGDAVLLNHFRIGIDGLDVC